ncbi:polymerase delta-interacting protein 3 isoform X2 [Brachyhypopomus gauderio]|uniref:polymerase delta-interacting protein 3 isoform X2 n=1 Tax=Brachyhypopomus gauderio TaxID=698409 RepID=UPI00404392F8
MADLSLDELIRRRNFNVRGAIKRPTFGRGALTVGRGASTVGRGALTVGRGASTLGRGASTLGRGVGLVGRTFDARQKIGTSDVRQRLAGGGASSYPVFPVKDAREKLGQKDARFRIRGRGGAVVQDARQAINSRKQQQVQDVPTVSIQTSIPQTQVHDSNTVNTGPRLSKVVDARDRLSLKRSITSSPNQGPAAQLKITKTIQRPVGMTSGIRINVPSRGAQGVSADDEDDDDDESIIPNKQMKITTANNLVQTRVGGGASFSLSPSITKVVKNDSYTAPPPPAPVAVTPTRSSARPPTQALQPVSRTMVAGQQTAANTSSQSAPPQPVFSPLEGTKITVNNLHPRVTEEDIVELFCVCGALKRARLVKVGVAEVVFVRKEDAVSAYRKYNNRCLDGQPMKCNLHIQGNVITSDQPILLRLSDSPAGGPVAGKKEVLPVRSTPRSAPAEVDPQTILKALFKSSTQSSSTSEPAAASATAFRIKI